MGHKKEGAFMAVNTDKKRAMREAPLADPVIHQTFCYYQKILRDIFLHVNETRFDIASVQLRAQRLTQMAYGYEAAMHERRSWQPWSDFPIKHEAELIFVDPLYRRVAGEFRLCLRELSQLNAPIQDIQRRVRKLTQAAYIFACGNWDESCEYLLAS